MKLQQTLKTHVALNLCAYNKFYLNRAFQGLYWFRCDSIKVVLFLNQYFNIYCVIISPRDAFGAQKNLKISLRKKIKSF